MANEVTKEVTSEATAATTAAEQPKTKVVNMTTNPSGSDSDIDKTNGTFETASKLASLRLINVELIDDMMQLLYRNNKEVFDMYFNLASIRANKIKERTNG